MFTKQRLWVLFALYMAINAALIFTMTPMADDWRCAAAPFVNDGSWYRIFPMEAFWRPFEGALAYFIGAHPYLYPYLNKFIVLCGHGFLCWALYRGLLWYTAETGQALVGTAFFALAPGVVATTSQIDGINQCWALVFGVLAVACYFRGWLSGQRRWYILYVALALISTLFKENGISWFLSPVFLHILYEYQRGTRTFLPCALAHKRHILLGIVYSLLYFCLRFAAAGKIGLGVQGGRYDFHPTLGLILKNFAIMHGSAYTCIDTLALFLQPHQWLVVGMTVLATLALLFSVLWVGKKHAGRKTLVVLVSLLLINMYNSFAQAVMHQVSEMSVYQMVFGFAFIMGWLWQYVGKERFVRLATVAFLLCATGVSLHKFALTHAYAQEVERYRLQYQNLFVHQPHEVLIFYVRGDATMGYSTYWQPAGHGLEQGRAFRCGWDWLDVDKHAKVVYCEQADEVEVTAADKEKYDTIFIQYQDGRVDLLKN